MDSLHKKSDAQNSEYVLHIYHIYMYYIYSSAIVLITYYYMTYN